MGFIWSYKAKLKLYETIVDKINEKLDSENIYSRNQIDQYFDDLGFIRIVRTKQPLGWKLEESKEDNSKFWKSINTPGFVHVSNPTHPGSFHKSDYLLRIPKEIAEKIMVIGMP